MLSRRDSSPYLLYFVVAYLLLFFPSIAFTFHAPLQDVQAWLDGTTVHFKVYDPNLGMDKEDTFQCTIAVSNLQTQEGIVTWRDGPDKNGKYDFGITVYDPMRECWVTYTGTGRSPTISIEDGVICVDTGGSLSYHYWIIYDAAIGDWKDMLGIFIAPVFKVGVFASQYRSDSGMTIGVSLGTYDPIRHSWRIFSWNVDGTEYDLPIDISIDDQGTGTWIFEGSTYRRGYHRDTGNWYDGPTLPIASFATVSTTSGPTWFTDMSLMATSWHYDFGDGTTSTLRSPFHKYAAVGEYLVTQTVTGPTGDHTTTRTVSVKNKYEITASGGGQGGSISPSGIISVWEGDSLTFNMTPSYPYFLSDVIVDGESIGAATSYTFTNVVADHTISVVFRECGESFESGDFSRYPWVTSVAKPWIVQDKTAYSGDYAAQAPTSLEGNQRSALSVKLDVETAMNISFYVKVSSEEYYDFLKFTIDGVEKGRWSGEVGWTYASYPVKIGEHTFAWQYFKDAEISKGSDTAWIDKIFFPNVKSYPLSQSGSFYVIPGKRGGTAIIYLE